eukprot:scaffold9176_cov104-Isochrysis_galbana.AAC.4
MSTAAAECASGAFPRARPTFVLKQPQRSGRTVVVCDADSVIDTRQAVPAVPARVGPKHRVRAQDVGGRRQRLDHGLLCVRLHREHVDHQRVCNYRIRQRPQHLLEGEDGSGDDEHVGLGLRDAVHVGHPHHAHRRRRPRIVGAGVRIDLVATLHPPLGQKLSKRSEPHDRHAQSRGAGGGGVGHVGGGGGRHRRRRLAQQHSRQRVAAEHGDVGAHLAEVPERVLGSLFAGVDEEVDVEGVLEVGGGGQALGRAGALGRPPVSRRPRSKRVRPVGSRLDLAQIDVPHREARERLEESPGLVEVGREDDGGLGRRRWPRRHVARQAGQDQEPGEVVCVVLDAVVEHFQPVHARRMHRGDGGRVAQPLLLDVLGRAGRVVRRHRRDLGVAQVVLRLGQRLRVAHRLFDVAHLDARQRQQRVAHAQRVLAEDVHAPVEPQQQVVVAVNRAAQRVLHRHRPILNLARRQRHKDILEGVEAPGVDAGDASRRERFDRRCLAVGAWHALVANSGDHPAAATEADALDLAVADAGLRGQGHSSFLVGGFCSCMRVAFGVGGAFPRAEMRPGTSGHRSTVATVDSPSSTRSLTRRRAGELWGAARTGAAAGLGAPLARRDARGGRERAGRSARAAGRLPGASDSPQRRHPTCRQLGRVFPVRGTRRARDGTEHVPQD